MTGSEELERYEAKHGRVSRMGYEYWRMRGEYSWLSVAGLDAWEARDKAEKLSERTPFDSDVEGYLAGLSAGARERKLSEWGKCR